MGPCGCSIARDADKEPDEQAAQVLRESAAEYRRQWQCPGAGGKEPAECSLEARESLVSVERLTGTKGLTTCPHWYASRPWAHHAARARRWREHGHLDAVATPTSALVYAVEEIDAGVSARQQDDDERRERKRDKHG